MPALMSLVRPPFGAAALTRPVPLTLAAGVINDAVRAAGLQGDPTAPAGSTWIGPAVTNLLTSPNDFSNAAWSVSNVTKTSTANVDPGGQLTGGLFTITNANHSLQATVSGLLASTAYELHFWAKRGTSTDCAYQVIDSDHASVIVGPVSYYSQLNSSTYSHVVVPFTTNAANTTVLCRLLINIAGIASGNINIAWPMLETGVVANPYTPTSRGAGRVQVPVAGLGITVQNGAWVICFAPGWSGAATGLNPRLATWGDDGTHVIETYVPTNSNTILGSSDNDANPTPAATHTLGVTELVSQYWTPTTIGIAPNGTAFTTASRPTVNSITAATIDLGSRAAITAGREAACNFLWAGFFSNALGVAANSSFFNNFLTTKPTVRQLKQRIGGRVGLWDGRTGTMQVSVGA